MSASHRLSCGVVVVRRADASGLRFLLLRAFNYWDIPKGMREPGEEPLATALREVREETTLTDLQFDWGYDYFETGPYSRGKVARYYLARTEQERVELPVNPELGRPEHSEFRWATFEDASDLSSPRVRAVIDWAIDVLNIA